LIFSLEFGGTISLQSVRIDAAAVAIASALGARGTAAVSLHLAGFDNTQSTGMLTFTFYDSAGNAIAPGAISVDRSGAFAKYFAGSGLGGAFALDATFPVTDGSPSALASFEVQLVNAAGTAQTGRITF